LKAADQEADQLNRAYVRRILEAALTPAPVRQMSGLDRVQAAVRAARGGDPPPQIQGYA